MPWSVCGPDAWSEMCSPAVPQIVVDHHVGDRLGEVAGEEGLLLAEIEGEALEDLHAELVGFAIIALERLAEARQVGPDVRGIKRRARLHFRIVRRHREADIEIIAGAGLAVAMHDVADLAIAAVVLVGLDLQPLGHRALEELVGHGDGMVDRLDRHVVVHDVEEADVVAGGANPGGDGFLGSSVVAVERADIDHRDAGRHRLSLSRKTCCHVRLQTLSPVEPPPQPMDEGVYQKRQRRREQGDGIYLVAPVVLHGVVDDVAQPGRRNHPFRRDRHDDRT